MCTQPLSLDVPSLNTWLTLSPRSRLCFDVYERKRENKCSERDTEHVSNRAQSFPMFTFFFHANKESDKIQLWTEKKTSGTPASGASEGSEKICNFQNL